MSFEKVHLPKMNAITFHHVIFYPFCGSNEAFASFSKRFIERITATLGGCENCSVFILYHATNTCMSSKKIANMCDKALVERPLSHLFGFVFVQF